MMDNEDDDMVDGINEDGGDDLQDSSEKAAGNGDERMPPMMEREIHDYRWHEGRRGRIISFEQAIREWRERHLPGYQEARPWHLNMLQRERIAQYIAGSGEVCSSGRRQELAIKWCKENAKKFRDDYEGDWGPTNQG